MRQFALFTALVVLCVVASGQSLNNDDQELANIRDLYDAPFTRNLVSFTCDVQFDWSRHFVQTLGAVPQAAQPTLKRLQATQHRVFVDRSGATISQGPKPDELSAQPHATELENALQAMITSGLNAWIPFATNVILPVRPTTFTVQHLDGEVKMIMNGPGVSATLLLQPDLRITEVHSESPQPLHFSTDFTKGPNGYLLQSVRTGAGATDDETWNASFVYQYQSVGGYQIPAAVSVTQISTGERWDYSLIDCRTMTGTSIRVEAPRK